MSSSRPLPLCEVNARTPCFVGPFAPKLALETNPTCSDLVYILRCAPQITGGPFTWYTGRCSRKRLGARMREHESGTASNFTGQNKPLFLEGLYEAPNKAVEAYAFFALMEMRSMDAVTYGRLGGWTQTRAAPSQLCTMRLREEKRMLSDQCLACGSADHSVAKCTKKASSESVSVDCATCGSTVLINALGKNTSKPSEPRGVQRSHDDAPASLARSSPSAQSVQSAVPQLQSREFARVKICGKEYSTLAWFCGKRTGEKQRKRVVKRFSTRGVELKNGDAKTLVKNGFARTKRRHPQELLPGHRALSSSWLDTDCKAARPPHKPLKVRCGCKGRNVLWLVDDLQELFE